MTAISTYNNLGQITSTQKLYENANLEFYARGQPYVLGEYDAREYYVDLETKTAVKFPDQPANTAWDYAAKQWVLNTNVATLNISEKREQLLIASDWTQLPNSPLVPEKKEAWATYRQALRDIPEQSGYPFNIVWPTKPA